MADKEGTLQLALAMAELRSDIINSAMDEILAEIAINNLVIKKNDDDWYVLTAGDFTATGKHRHKVVSIFIAELAKIGLRDGKA